MKKYLLFVLAAVLFSFAVASAQETATELPTLSFQTVGHLFNWGDSREKVFDFLLNYEEAGLEISIEENGNYGSYIMATAEPDNEKNIYAFYFHGEKEELHQIECVAVFKGGQDLDRVMDSLSKLYGLNEANPYESETTNDYISGYDRTLVVAGDETIGILAGSYETDESYPKLALVFLDRIYFEE